MKDIRYARQAMKVLRKVDARTRVRLMARIDQLASGTAPDVKDLGDDLFRTRVGDWRIIYSDDGLILVIKIGARGDVYNASQSGRRKTVAHQTKSIDRQDFVLVPIADYERLQDQLDKSDALDVRARLDAGAEESLPADLVRALSDGESPVRVYRRYRGINQQALASAAGITQGAVSQIEKGTKQMSLETARRMAAALDIDLDDLTPWDQT